MLNSVVETNHEHDNIDHDCERHVLRIINSWSVYKFVRDEYMALTMLRIFEKLPLRVPIDLHPV